MNHGPYEQVIALMNDLRCIRFILIHFFPLICPPTVGEQFHIYDICIRGPILGNYSDRGF